MKPARALPRQATTIDSLTGLKIKGDDTLDARILHNAGAKVLVTLSSALMTAMPAGITSHNPRFASHPGYSRCAHAQVAAVLKRNTVLVC
jgi:hypothetical protein